MREPPVPSDPVSGDSQTHWQRWHADYADPTSAISRRLVVVQAALRDALDRAPAGPLRLLSMCAGTGADVIGVLRDHPRRHDVVARLVELDAGLAAGAATAAADARLDRVEVVRGDASLTDAFAGIAPADVLLVCGVFGNVADDDIRSTIDELAHLASPGATVIWTRHRRPPDRTPQVRAWFVAAGFEEHAWETATDVAYGVGVSRLTAPPRPFRPGRRMFTFVGDGAAAMR